MKKALLAALTLALSASAHAQSWPSKPIRLLVGFAPGGTADVSARFTGDSVSKELGQPVIIENRPGGAGSVGIEATMRSPADGYTLFVGSDSAFYQPVLRPELAYRWEKDLKPVTILTIQPIVIVVNPAPGWKNIGDLVKTAKARPGQIAYALSSATGTQAVAGAAFFKLAGVKMVSVPYKGGGQAIVDLVSGQVPVAVLGSAPVVPQLKAGRVRVLAVTSKTRSKIFPDVPTLAEQGYPQIDLAQWFGVVAPCRCARRDRDAAVRGVQQGALRSDDRAAAVRGGTRGSRRIAGADGEAHDGRERDLVEGRERIRPHREVTARSTTANPTGE